VVAQRELRDTMSELARSGVGIVLVTHHVEDVIPEIERVVLMRDGRVVADGRKEDLLTTSQLTDLFGVDVEVGRKNGHYHLW
jgi:iron complex transport system ATP-binding protein